MTSNIEKYENSVQDGIPIECYKFSYNGMNYLITSSAKDIELQITENGVTRTEKYYAEHVKREAIKPGSSNSLNNCIITVSKDYAIAKLYQGPPPETPVTVTVYRLHEPDTGNFDVVLYARICQANFKDSECELTASQENWLSKEIPNGTNQYYCNNVLFNHRCRLNKKDFQVEAVFERVDGLNIYSSTFANYEDGYFENGRIYCDGYVRMISEHKGNRIKISYPFISMQNNHIVVVPGCNYLLRTCAKKFNNHLNFSGVPYCAPTDSVKNPTGKGAYWVDSLVIQRDTNGFVGTIDI